jgi:hypothetical protein
MIADGMRRLRHRERMRDLGFPPGRAEQDGRGAQPPDGTQRHDELGPVRRHQRHPVACPDPSMLERRGHAAGQRVKLGQRVFALVEGECGRLAH